MVVTAMSRHGTGAAPPNCRGQPRGSTLPFEAARLAISCSRSTAAAAPSSRSASSFTRSRSEVSWRSRCFSSGANSKRPASSKESCSPPAAGSSTSAPVSSTSLRKSSSARSASAVSAGSSGSSSGSTSAGLERSAARQLDEPEALAALDDDVQPSVVEPVEYLGDRRPRADLAQPVLVGVDQSELALVREALADQLLVAVLEDVERDLLGRQEHDPEREESEL